MAEGNEGARRQGASEASAGGHIIEGALSLFTERRSAYGASTATRRGVGGRLGDGERSEPVGQPVPRAP